MKSSTMLCMRIAIYTSAVLLKCAAELSAQQPVFNPGVNINQEMLLAGKYPLRKVLESGGQFFSTPYTPIDGVGEGAAGPRSGQRAKMYPNNPSFPFLRVNGLDSQSCYECHNSIGSYVEPGTQSAALLRKSASSNGGAGFNADAFINPLFPTPLTLLVRNPPHVFGTGYTQQLATEMTHSLQLQIMATRSAAMNSPGVKQTMKLTAKTTDFGVFGTTFNKANGTYNDDFTGVVGVPVDGIVRPLQWKGIASSVRHFVRDALDFHFSMQAVEKVGVQDCDRDGISSEVTIGNVSALVAFVAMTRPPMQETPTDPNQLKTVSLGQQIFSGQGSPRIPSGNKMCATCHTPSLTLTNPVLLIEIPPPVPSNQDCPTEAIPTLTDPVPTSDHLHVIRLFKDRFKQVQQDAAVKQAEATAKSPEVIHQAYAAAFEKTVANNPVPPSLGYSINLTNPGDSLPNYIYPRLPADATTGQVEVPLFSDLRTHNMGKGLQDPPPPLPPQGTDVANISIPAPLFLTRPLWGVADTGPWLHDGRARTLSEAITMHAGEGSEANPVIDAFNGLSDAEKQAVVAFLLTMRLPVQKGLQIQN